MKKWKLTNEDKEKLIRDFAESLEDYEAEDTVSYEVKVSEPAKEKIEIIFTPEAYLKSEMLVQSFSGEVGWNGLMQKLSDKQYLVYDIIVYPQVVNGARTLDPTTTNEWYEQHEDDLDVMNFQAHSHVEMATIPSTTDKDNQREIVKNTQGHGYKLFQIWNKKGDINSFFYDIDNNLVYDRNEITITIQCGDSTMAKFIKEAKDLVGDINPPKVTTFPTTYKPQETGYQWKAPEFWPAEKEEKMKDPFYWSDGTGHEGW